MKKHRVLRVLIVVGFIIMGYTGMVYADLTNGLVAYYPFNGNADDDSGNGHDGLEHGGINYIAGKIGQAVNLDGVDDYISVNDSNVFNLSGDYTLSAWVKLVYEEGRYARILDKATAGSCDGWVFDTYDRNDIGRKMRMDVSCPWVNSNTIFSLNDWHLLTVSVNNQYASFYLDGIYDGGGSVSTTPVNSLDLYIGATHPATGKTQSGFFDGILDELRIYNRALSESEIQQLYNGNNNHRCDPPNQISVITPITSDEISNAPVALTQTINPFTGQSSNIIQFNFCAYNAPVDVYIAIQRYDGILFFVSNDYSLTAEFVPVASGQVEALEEVSKLSFSGNVIGSLLLVMEGILFKV